MTNKGKKNSDVKIESPEYARLITEIGNMLDDARRNVLRAVNAQLTSTYWHIGRRIVEFEQSGKARAKYGESLLSNLSTDLTAKYDRGFNERNLRYMRQFYQTYKNRNTLCSKSRKRNAIEMKGGWNDCRLVNCRLDNCSIISVNLKSTITKSTIIIIGCGEP
ncbi:MAG: DUF1016 N-terminal domain-containing protein [Thermoplasmata archaeon]|nr:DUF1016 N-terminal domain-containing protein [Thermoplasmata archaeon]